MTIKDEILLHKGAKYYCKQNTKKKNPKNVNRSLRTGIANNRKNNILTSLGTSNINFPYSI